MTDRPLRGWTIGVTADRRAGEQVELLERRGARVVHAPAMRTVPLTLDDRVAAAIQATVENAPDAVVLSTGIGTRALFDAADAIGLGERLRASFAGAEVLARGPKAHGAALTAGVAVAWQAPSATSAEVIAHLEARGIAGRRVAVQVDGRDVPFVVAALARLGADVVPLPVYRWTRPADGGPVTRLVGAIGACAVDAVTFTSAPALTHLLLHAREIGHERTLVTAFGGPVCAVSIGPVCSAAARAAGIEPAVEPRRHRLGSMVMALADHARERTASETRRVGARTVELRAGAVVVDGEVVELPARERAVLAALLEGAVLTKEQLRRVAWASSAHGHAVEVAVGRLRRRLAGHLAVRTVPKRGYLLSD